MKFPFPFKSNEITFSASAAAAASSWPWPSCATTPRTLSFRADISPAHLDHDQSLSPHHHANPESAVISGLRSDRLFFDPGATSSILAEAKTDDDGGGGESDGVVATVVMDSRNPFLDFRVSMAEMVEACGVRDWEFLEELLEWYLRVNDETNHGYIVGAFVDLLISAIHQETSSSVSSSSSSAATKHYFASPLSFSSSSTEEEILVHKNV
ncbi:transcription repressor OFP15-like [Salvia miltiorrhiza]|uniref:transcription repressor OFP15-like n=1 Tax=Salvia miltiorrhiza TaxID=226208 RepID=UPI0025AD4834|nr:transcription repressor OFP15-like [Salvia miltiorrhiza]